MDEPETQEPSTEEPTTEESTTEEDTEPIEEEKKASFYSKINNDAVRITFLTVAMLTSELSLLNSWVLYSILKYWFLIADY